MLCSLLPTECYLEILRYVASPKALYELVHVNRQLRDLTLPLLYHSVSLVHERSVRQFCRTVQNDPGLARLVRRFSVASSASPQDEQHDFLADIHSALKNMASLTELSIRLTEQPPYQKRHWIFESTTFQLRRLELRMDYDSALISFLSRQPLLESLTLLGAVPNHYTSLQLELPSEALPCLTQFNGHYTQALAVVPGRPVRSVHITQVDDTGDFEPSDVFVCLKDTVEMIGKSASMGPLEEITLDDEDGDYGLLETVLLNIPMLKTIHMNISRQGHSWRRYSSPQWPSYVSSCVQDQPLRLERLNTSHDSISPLPVLPIFQPSTRSQTHSRAGFHAGLWFGQRGNTLIKEYTMRNWKLAFPKLGNVEFVGEQTVWS